jgi:hypothetical protein
MNVSSILQKEAHHLGIDVPFFTGYMEHSPSTGSPRVDINGAVTKQSLETVQCKLSKKIFTNYTMNESPVLDAEAKVGIWYSKKVLEDGNIG